MQCVIDMSNQRNTSYVWHISDAEAKTTMHY